MKKAEGFKPPGSEQVAKGAEYVASYHGYNGPVQVTYPDDMYGGPQQGAFIETIMSITGIMRHKDLNGGRPNGVSITPLSINSHHGNHRSSSAQAYLTPVESYDTTWTTLTDHIVTKINWKNQSLPLTASGIEFASTDQPSSRYMAFARREVIVAAGAIASPKLIQLSGIGDADILGPLGIDTRIDLKTVGKNLQEQTINLLGANGSGFNPGGRGPSDVIAFPNIHELFGSQADAMIDKVKSSLDTWAASQADYAMSAAALREIYQVQANPIINNNAPVVELFYNTGYPADIGMYIWQLLPFSRGQVKITSADPFVKPETKVNYFSIDYDLSVQIAGARLCRRIFDTPPLSSLSTGEAIPGKIKVPDNGDGGSDTDWKNWITADFGPVAHTIGTNAMMKRSLGGVVDAHLKIYDTSNVRVVDASIIPLQISAHLASTLYGVAEKAADLIKADWGSSADTAVFQYDVGEL